MSDYTNDKKLIIAVATHKDYRMPEDTSYLPVFAGSALRHDPVPDGYQRDDSGENISMENGRYSELTALYWAWKNTDSDYLGIVHYRRYFRSRKKRPGSERIAGVAGGEELSDLLKKTDVILAKKRHYYVETMFSHYAHTHDGEHLMKMRKILESRDPEYLDSFDHVMNSRSAHMYNMFIMKRSLADEYCGWLFPLLKELDAKVNPKDYDDYQGRYVGRIGEILLDVWIRKNSMEYLELPVLNIEPVNWPKKGIAFLLAKYFGKKYKESF